MMTNVLIRVQTKKKRVDLVAFVVLFLFRYIRSERSIILLNFCLSIICSNILILVGQTQTHNVVSAIYRFILHSLNNLEVQISIKGSNSS